MINPLKLAQSLVGNSIKLHSVNFFTDFVYIDFSIPGMDRTFTGDGDTLEEAMKAALDLAVEFQTRDLLLQRGLPNESALPSL